MELVNQSIVPASLLVSQTSETSLRGGMLVAKATFDLDAFGNAHLATQRPLPMLSGEMSLDDLGCMPADLVPRDDDAFEVILLGACYGRNGQPTQRQCVTLGVGPVLRHLVVTGDRFWKGCGASAVVSEPQPFTRMPLTYDRAFGGSAKLMLDADSPYPLFHPLNVHGRGMDASHGLAICASHIECPPGFPLLIPAPRLLPNIEDPAHLISRWSDDPEPVCWATIPADAGMLGLAHAARQQQLGAGASVVDLSQAIYLRAHPDWTFVRPPAAGAFVQAHGVSPPRSPHV